MYGYTQTAIGVNVNALLILLTYHQNRSGSHGTYDKETLNQITKRVYPKAEGTG